LFASIVERQTTFDFQAYPRPAKAFAK